VKQRKRGLKGQEATTAKNIGDLRFCGKRENDEKTPGFVF
jgi:hypothetical protein